jgi:hypothetical protein
MERLEKLTAALAEQGIKLTGISEEETIKIAKKVGIDAQSLLPREEVQVVPYTNKREQTNMFVKTPSYVVGTKENGKPERVRGLFIRLSALDQVIEDLTRAREIADEMETDSE